MNRFVRSSLVGFLSTVWIFSLSISYGQDVYHVEISGESSQLETDDDYEARIYALAGEIHFSPVDAGGHPLAEAAFLERVGGLMLLKGRHTTILVAESKLMALSWE